MLSIKIKAITVPTQKQKDVGIQCTFDMDLVLNGDFIAGFKTNTLWCKDGENYSMSTAQRQFGRKYINVTTMSKKIKDRVVKQVVKRLSVME